MQYIKLRSRGSSVSFLQELLRKIGYETPSSGYFGIETEVAVKDFQSKNQLVVDGEVGIKTWTLLFDKTKPADVFGSIFLSEQDLIDFAKRYQVDLAAVKAVNEVESSGKGFFIDGRPKILFEGHIFWRQLKARGINPEDFANSTNEHVLYKSYTKKHYLGGSREYERLEQAASISPDPRFREAALASASWGSYQVMGFHAVPLGYPSVQQFVDDMYIHERNHLEVFGRYILKNGCLDYLQAKNWAKFAACYNGPAYATNKYDEKMAKAYLKFEKDTIL
ncbi:Peptidoglycan-binding (PGRP) domain of peptidoglycan hydrolases-containing protein [Algoriphagus locisalis]|uniref:Peptidoglycan-binding (PGRP) domain of peptidoglycan hydrolases-containing protein n=1 Tax=Algoriphagus locisalis TaxID=305507 RepID=A0A1I6YHJ9_9BACT|nr:N-acetylmuramidase family protein [Algoriphagus locisalis]SFT49880.1 Peptidoglycan-binding (PGRP) domain of peptidoglycan hydrolases-containing protein [Algoriphagus locisalis]